MPLITGRADVFAVYARAAENKWVIPCFCSENLTTTEAILAAAAEHGEAVGIPDLPVSIAITNQYAHRTQSAYYTHTRRWDIGLALFRNDLDVLTGAGSPYHDITTLVHLDHAQHDADSALFNDGLSRYSSIMYDASSVSFDENIQLTRAFMERFGDIIVVEGACDEIIDAVGTPGNALTSPEHAERYARETGVDFMVANLGTEHRASAATLRYDDARAREISAKVGPKIVLHGASSVPAARIAGLYNDGVCKVNIWTVLERDSAPALMTAMKENEERIAGAKPDIGFYTTTWRQSILFHSMKDIVRRYLSLWYRKAS
ncbi:MAG: class II fructose-bisphosphate aldolase [Spirochaetes bacterium]|nr:class II fructose-bisphosphate aldolase [Spirochaetota bacterium]